MRPAEVCLFIGEESGYAPLSDCSVVSAPYSVDGEVVGVLGGDRADADALPADHSAGRRHGAIAWSRPVAIRITPGLEILRPLPHIVLDSNFQGLIAHE